MNKAFATMIVTLCMLFIFLLPTYAKKLSFDSNGDIYYEYGDGKYFDGDVVTSKTFKNIRIFSAIEMDDFAVVKEELASGIGIDASIKLIQNDGDWFEYTPLIFSIIHGKEEIAKNLVEMGASLYKKVVVRMAASNQTFDMTPVTAAFSQLSSEDAPLSIDFIMYIVGKLDNMSDDLDAVVGQNYNEKLVDFYFSKICTLFIDNEDRQLNCLARIMQGAGFIGVMRGDSQFAKESADCVVHVMCYQIALEKRGLFLQWFKNVYSPYFGPEYSGQRQYKRVEKIFELIEKENTLLNTQNNQHNKNTSKTIINEKKVISDENSTLVTTVPIEIKPNANEKSTLPVDSKEKQSNKLELKYTDEKKRQKSSAVNNMSYVIEVSSIPGKFKDNIVLINKVDDSMVAVKINALSNEKLVPIETVALRWFDDEFKINSSKALKLADFKTFQIESSDGKKYSYKTEKHNNDLIIEVREWGSDLSKSATPKWTANSEVFLFDMESLEEEPDENVKILCNSSRGVGNVFTLYAYETKYKRWIPYGSLQVKKQGKAEKLKKEKDVDDIDDYRYFAIETKNANIYKYHLEENRDDLFITVDD